MMTHLMPVIIWLNALANGLGHLLAPIGLLPDWVSATLVSIVTGILLLLAFKYTSNQQAIKRVRRDIKAHLLALKLFKESILVSLKAQGRVLYGALRLFLLALVPLVAMLIPVALLLGQLSLWYQARPLRIGEEAVVTLKLDGQPNDPWPDVRLQPTDGVEELIGPVRVRSKREICWSVRAKQNGIHRLVFLVDGQQVDKEIAVGDALMRVSLQRPPWDLLEALENPREEPLRPGSPIQSITIAYSPRTTILIGTNWWLVYWFVVSLIAGFSFRRVLNVDL
jgi:hypothetical protein